MRLRLIGTMVLPGVLAIVAALPAAAETVRNDSAFSVALHGGPGRAFRIQGRIEPGQTADLSRCEADGIWCIASSDTGWGWVDTTGLGGFAAPPAGPAAPVPAPGPVTTTTLPPVTDTAVDSRARGGARPLPQSVLDAVSRAETAPGTPQSAPEIAGVAPPMIFATDAPFYNVTDGVVNLRAGPGTEYDILGRIEPGEGGYLDVCDPGQSWCRIETASGQKAWVKMVLVGIRRF